ncbi:MAG: hypothetical protein EA387_16590 [Nitriliruptor sp.]|nr:MAG: hypothetical protein EA387_16590 [Nitriliruptor sp.]
MPSIPRATSMLLALAAVLLAACSDGDDGQAAGEGWQQVADLDELPDLDRYPVIGAVDDGSLADAWEHFDLSGEPPSVDHDQSVTLLLAGIGACTEDQNEVLGEDIEIEVVNGRIVVDVDGELLRCVTHEVERTFVVTIDRDALGDTETIGVQAPNTHANRPIAVERTDTPPDVVFVSSDDALSLAAEPDPVTVGDTLALDLGLTDAVDTELGAGDLRPADLEVLAWDGIQWLRHELPGTEVVASEAAAEGQPIARFEVDTNDLDPGGYLFRVRLAGGDQAAGLEPDAAAFVRVRVEDAGS